MVSDENSNLGKFSPHAFLQQSYMYMNNYCDVNCLRYDTIILEKLPKIQKSQGFPPSFFRVLNSTIWLEMFQAFFLPFECQSSHLHQIENSGNSPYLRYANST